MAIKRYDATQDNTITNAFKADLRTKATGSNMGASDILETFVIHGQTSASISAQNAEEARILIQFDLNKTALSQAWQSLRDQANFDFTEYQSDKERKISAINALLGNEAFMTEDKYNSQRNKLLFLMNEFGDTLEDIRDTGVLEVTEDLRKAEWYLRKLIEVREKD